MRGVPLKNICIHCKGMIGNPGEMVPFYGDLSEIHYCHCRQSQGRVDPKDNILQGGEMVSQYPLKCPQCLQELIIEIRPKK